ncbi:MAG: hypothetical protein JXB13_12925 [Phycisphaerae bacterium]|nr:hypothetical protein [Phycisphaerae bacterium]
MTFGFYARNGVLGSDWAREQVVKMAALNIRWVALVATVMQDTAHTTTQYRDFEVTPNDHELYSIIEAFHAAGIRVCLRPMLETQDGCGRLGVCFQPDRERIPGRVSDHWARWFRSMRLRSVHYARIAQDTGCELYGLDSELDLTVDHDDDWKRVIDAVRGVYDGPVTSCHTTHTRAIDWDAQLARKDHWWRELDMLQLSCYAKGADRPGASADAMAANLEPERDRFRRLAAAYGKPMGFGECGCTSSSGGAMTPSGWTPGGGFDPHEQANYYDAVLKTFWNEPWCNGMYWWKWDEQNDRPHFKDDPSGDKGFTIDGKLASDVIKRWYGRTDRP